MTRTAAKLGPGGGHGWGRAGSLSRYVGNRTHGSVFGIGARARSRAPPAPSPVPNFPMAGAGVKGTEGARYVRHAVFIARQRVANPRRGNLGPSSNHERPGSPRGDARGSGGLRETGAASRATCSRARHGVAGSARTRLRATARNVSKRAGRSLTLLASIPHSKHHTAREPQCSRPVYRPSQDH
jgi:hypothetical protein